MVGADATILPPGLCPESPELLWGKRKEKIVLEAAVMEKDVNGFKWASLP